MAGAVYLDLIIGEVGGYGEVGLPQVLDADAAVFLFEMRIEVRVIEKTVTRQRVTSERTSVDEHPVHSRVDCERVHFLSERGSHRGAAGCTADKIEADTQFSKSAVDADVRRAVGAAAASDEPESFAGQKAPQPGDVLGFTERHVVVHRRFAQCEPMARALNDPFASVHDDKPPRCRPMQRQGKCFERAQRHRRPDRAIKRGSDDQQFIRLADGFLAPWRQFAIGDKDDRREPAFERVQRFREVEVAALSAIEHVRDRAA